MVTDAPPPDVRVDAALAARLVAAQHPDLAGRVRLVANGWDNAMFRLGDDYVVRMPRRSIAAALVLGSSIVDFVDIVGVEGRLGRVGVHALEQVLAD